MFDIRVVDLLYATLDPGDAGIQFKTGRASSYDKGSAFVDFLAVLLETVNKIDQYAFGAIHWGTRIFFINNKSKAALGDRLGHVVEAHFGVDCCPYFLIRLVKWREGEGGSVDYGEGWQIINFGLNAIDHRLHCLYFE